MSVICSTTGEIIKLNEIYIFLAEVVPKCGQVRNILITCFNYFIKTSPLTTFAR